MKTRLTGYVTVALAAMYLCAPMAARAAGIDDLVVAVWGSDTDKVVALVEGGVDVKGKDANGTFPLILACSYQDNDEMIALLLERGADPNVHGPNGETPLGLAAKYSLRTVEMLVEKGADVNAKYEPGFTALRWAREMGQEEVIRYLKEHGAKEQGPDVDGEKGIRVEENSR